MRNPIDGNIILSMLSLKSLAWVRQSAKPDRSYGISLIDLELLMHNVWILEMQILNAVNTVELVQKPCMSKYYFYHVGIW